MTSGFGISALQADLDALADATTDSGGLAGDIVQRTTRVVAGMRLGVLPKLDDPDDGGDDDPDSWVAVDNGGEFVVVGPEFMMTADGDGTSATIVHGSISWSLHRSADDGSWRVTAFDGGEVAADVTLANGQEIDHRDTDAINDELEQQMQEIVDQAVEHEAQIFDAAESGQSTTPSSGDTQDDGSTSSPAPASDTGGGGQDVGSMVAGTAATMAAGAVVSGVRKTLSGRAKETPPMLPPPPPPWRRTHVVPAQGISAWAIPDGRAAPVATLPAGVQLELTRMQGPWAEVVASNGWRGWVDPSVLLPAPPG